MVESLIFVGLIFIWRMIPIIISAVIASRKEMSEILWAFLGLFFGWLAVLVVACLRRAKQKDLYCNTEDLIKLKKLLDNHIITQEEFDKKKKEILSL